MLNEKNKSDIKSLWDNYIASGTLVKDLKGTASVAKNFDERRLHAITEIKVMISDYLKGKTELKTFKSMLDGYNKRNNLWGFAAMKGQMFFNQLVNATGSDLDRLDGILKECISNPINIEDAKKKIVQLENYIDKISEKIEEKRKAPKKGSVSYFLSYFWQIENPEKFPIIYTSLINNLETINLWKEFESYSDEYEYFYNMLYAIKDFLEKTLKQKISHWDVEHCFWQSLTDQGVISPAKKTIRELSEKASTPLVKSSFEMIEYIPPIVADLIEAGSLKGDTRAVKGYSFEKKVATLFKMLDFELETLGQGKGREPDGVITNRQENIAFIYDAKVRENGYSIGTDNRAIKEYVNRHYPKLERQGYKKIGFLIISTTFNGSAADVIREVTLDTPIKRFALVTSEALLSLLAYKLSLGISLADISDFLLDDGVLAHEDVKERFSDV